MARLTFPEDVSSRRATRFLLLLQGTGLILVLCLRLFHLVIPALAISLLTLIGFMASLFWLYARYSKLPRVREKQRVQQFIKRFQKRAKKERELIRGLAEERDRLMKAERQEIALAQMGLETVAAPASTQQTTNSAPESEITRPLPLAEKQLEVIHQKYQVLQEQKAVIEAKARASRDVLQYALSLLRPLGRELAPLTFLSYLHSSLATHGMPAGLLASGLIVAQVVTLVIAVVGIGTDL